MREAVRHAERDEIIRRSYLAEKGREMPEMRGRGPAQTERPESTGLDTEGSTPPLEDGAQTTDHVE